LNDSPKTKSAGSLTLLLIRPVVASSLARPVPNGRANIDCRLVNTLGKSMHFRKIKKKNETEKHRAANTGKHRYKSNSIFNYEIFMAQYVGQ